MKHAISCSKLNVRRGSSNAYRVQGGSGGKSFISVMICGSACGEILPLFIVYRTKQLFQEWCLSGPAGTEFSDLCQVSFGSRDLFSFRP
jgi:hypothetical protein